MDWKVPLFDLDYGEAESAAVQAVLDDRWLTLGARTVEFERRFAESTGAAHAIAVANGTAALHLGMLAAGVGPGDEVLVPDITFVATANAAVYAGATAVLVDVCGGDDMTIDPDDARGKITSATKAIAPVHLAGYPCRMDEIRALAEQHGLAIVEDCAHAPGSRYGDEHVGRSGMAGCFSFFSNKNLSTGEGGMVITDDDETAEAVRLWRSHCLSAQTAERHTGEIWGYDIVDLGYNYRMTEIEAALGLVQLGKLADANASRARVDAMYRQRLGGVEGVTTVFDRWEESRPPGSVSSHHVRIVLLPPGASQADVARRMSEDGVQTSYHYRPIHTFSSPHIARMRAEGLEVSSGLASRIITLPMYPAMTEADVDTVVSALAAALG